MAPAGPGGQRVPGGSGWTGRSPDAVNAPGGHGVPLKPGWTRRSPGADEAPTIVSAVNTIQLPVHWLDLVDQQVLGYVSSSWTSRSPSTH